MGIKAEVVFKDNEIFVNAKTIYIDTESNEVSVSEDNMAFWTIEDAIKYCLGENNGN